VALTIVILFTCMALFFVPIPDILLESFIFIPDIFDVSDIPDTSPPELVMVSPVSVTVCPTCPARETFLLVTSYVLPSLVTSLNVPGLSPFCRHPVAESAAAAGARDPICPRALADVATAAVSTSAAASERAFL
jgi:hypothetical protein